MQPYLFPYIGYFQLIHAVDAFVVYDDVTFIKGGWINRNFILSQGNKTRITLQLHGASQNLLINEISIGNNRVKILKSIQRSYSKSPQFNSVFPLIEEVLLYKENNLAKFIDYSIKNICNYLGIKTKWLLSSDIKKNLSLRGQDKILDVCKKLGSTQYINASGGRDLYDSRMFENKGVKLSFIESNEIRYSQFHNDFVPNLSIIDVMMFNSLERCTHLLKEYSID